MESPNKGASCSRNCRNNGNNCEGEGVPNENLNPIIEAMNSNNNGDIVAARASRSETLSTGILGLPSAIAQFLAPETLGTQFIVELKENEEGGRSIQIRKRENKRMKLIDSNHNQGQLLERCRNCEPPPSHKVVSIEHIFERILGYLDFSDLLRCRLVSHHFKAFAGSFLQNRIQLKIVDLGIHDHGSGKLLSDLTTLLRNEHADLPCNNVQFVEAKEYLNWQDEALQDFFDSFGSRIENLSFLSRKENLSLSMSLFAWYIRGSGRDNYKRVKEDWVKGIKGLLLAQTRNLQYLSIKVPFPRNGEPQRCNLPESGLFFTKTDEGFCQVEQKCRKVPHKHRNLNLKLLEMGGNYDGVPLQLLETIIQLSPNLQEVLIDHHNYMPFIQPLNRLDLLKTVEIKFGNQHGLAAVKKVLDFIVVYDRSPTPRLFQLRHLKLFLNEETNMDYGNRSAAYISAINQLLAYTGGSLESFSWTVDGGVNLDEIQFPRDLPNVKKVVLKSVRNSSGPFFPPGFNFPEMFPNLRELVLLASGRFGGLGPFTEKLDFERQFQQDVTMKTVSRVQIEGRSWEIRNLPSPKCLTQFKAWFPNAHVTYKRIIVGKE